MGDSRISQEAIEVIVDSPNTCISQEQVEALVATANTRISQEVIESITATANSYISQLQAESITVQANTIISQLTIELLRGPEVVPPTETPVGTFTFDEGLGNSYFMLLQLSDYGEELRDHVVKAFRLTGKVTNLRAQVYAQGAEEDIDIDDMQAGVNSQTGVITLPDTTQVQRSRRRTVNVKNAATSTIRVDGRWLGDGIRDRIDEIVVEAAQQGRRR